MAKCKICGEKEALPNKDICMQCAAAERNSRPNNPRNPGGRYGAGRERDQVPNKCIFKDSFYADDGYLKREVLIESSEEMAYIFQRNRMTQTSFRQLFNLINNMRMSIRRNKDLSLGFVRENFGKFVAHLDYQVNRDIIKPIFKDFVYNHRDLALSDKKEFLGFAEYLTAILCRMRQK